MSLIPQNKYGDCSRCRAENTDVVKIGKDLFCLACNRQIKLEKQLEKAKDRNKLRGELKKQIQGGNHEDAGRQALVNELDRIFSRIIRLRAADEYSNCKCFTCKANKHWSMMQCGHFVSRGNTQLRWEFINNKVQCKSCNEGLAGNLKVYAENLDKEQPGLSEQLIEKGREVYSWTLDELKQLLVHLRAELRIAEGVFREKTGMKV